VPIEEEEEEEEADLYANLVIFRNYLLQPFNPINLSLSRIIYKIQFVPRSKHPPSQKTIRYCRIEKYLSFGLGFTQNT
jgi:hypothetical protein